MEDNLKDILHKEISEPLNNIVNIFTPKVKKANYKLMALWIIVGLLAMFLFYYAYKMIFITFS